jgi:hypothetical protein
LGTILGRSSISLWLIVCLIIIEYIYISSFDSLIFFIFFMTVHVTTQPNIDHGLKDQIIISLTLFNTILEIANTRAGIECSWAMIEQDISVRERWEARQRHPRNQP